MMPEAGGICRHAVEKTAVQMNAKPGCRLGEAGEFQSAIASPCRGDAVRGDEIELARGRIQAGSVAALAGFGSETVAKIGGLASCLVAARPYDWRGPIVDVQPVALDAGVDAELRHQEFRVTPAKLS